MTDQLLFQEYGTNIACLGYKQKSNIDLARKSLYTLINEYLENKNDSNLDALGDIHRVCKKGFHQMRRKFRNKNRFYVSEFTKRKFENIKKNYTITKDTFIKIEYTKSKNASFDFSLVEGHSIPYSNNNKYYSFYSIHLFDYFLKII